MSAPTRWVVYRLGHLGDVVLATGVLDFWHRTRGWRFAVVTRAPFAPVFDNHPAVDEVTGLEEAELRGTAAWLGTARGLSRRFAGRGLIDLHGTLRSRILRAAWSGPVLAYPKLGLVRRLFRLTRSEAAGRRLAALNVPQRYSLASGASPPPREAVRPRIFLRAEETEAAGGLLAARGLDLARPITALHPYATHNLKAWPAEHWRELVRLLEADGRQWLAIGRDKAPLRPGDPRDLTNQTDLRLTCSVLSLTQALVTGDSGPMHLATAVGTPVLALFGPTTVHWGFYPSGQDDRVLELPLSCRPCSLHGSSGCRRGRECLAGLAPAEVLHLL